MVSGDKLPFFLSFRNIQQLLLATFPLQKRQSDSKVFGILSLFFESIFASKDVYNFALKDVHPCTFSDSLSTSAQCNLSLKVLNTVEL